MIFHRRLPTVLALTATSFFAFMPPVSAGCLCDWLFGRPPAYAAGYAPVYPVGPAYPVTPGYAANMPVLPPVVTTSAPVAYGAPTAYAAQMPAYGSAPVLPNGYAGAYSSLYGGAAASAAPMAPSTLSSSLYGTGNAYANSPTPYPGTSYSANMPATYNAPGVTAYSPAATPYMAGQPAVVAPPVVPVAPPRTGLFPRIRGFFGNLFGTNYRTSYYRAPVTYYRPQTTVDPATGTTVTVQRPCTSYQYQVQRMPYVSLDPGASTPVGAAPVDPCANISPYGGTAPYGQTAPGLSGMQGGQFDPYAQPSYGQPNYGQATPGGQPAPLNNTAPGASSEGYVPQPTLPPIVETQRYPTPAVPSLPSTPSTGPLTGSPTPPSTAPTTRYHQQPYAGGSANSPFPSTPSTQPAAPSQQLQGYQVPSSGASVSPVPPAEYARPIPAPPTNWDNRDAAPVPSREVAGGRTASRPAWGFKTISWSKPVDDRSSDIQRATYDNESLSLSAPANESTRAAQPWPTPTREPVAEQLPELRSAPTRPAVTAPRVKAYDDSGWRSNR